MKVVMAITAPQRLDSVRAALHTFGADRMTVTDLLQAIPEHRRRIEIYRGMKTPLTFAPRVRLEIVADTRDAYDLMRVIASAIAAEPPAEATVWVIQVDAVANIRTGLRRIPAL